MTKVQLYLINPEKYLANVMKILKTESKDKATVYVTASRTYGVLTEAFKKEKIDISNILFIDCVTKQMKKPSIVSDNCIYLDAPSSLTAMSITINEAMRDFGDAKKLLFLDSVSTLMIYNNANNVTQFSSFLVNKMRELHVDTIILALTSDVDKETVKHISSFADEVKR